MATEFSTKSPEAAPSPSAATALAQAMPATTAAEIEMRLNEIAQISSAAVRALEIKQLAIKHKIPIKSITADVDAIRQEQQAESSELKIVPSAHYDGLVDIVVYDEKPVYLTKVPHLLIEGEYTLVLEEAHQDGDLVLIPPPRKSLPFSLVQGADVIDCYHGGPDKSLFRDIFNYFGEFSFLTVAQNLIITLYTLLTFMQDHSVVHYLAEIFFHGPAERGKSRTGRAFTYVAYRAIHLNGIKEANIFRFSEDLHATLFVDVKDFEAQTKRNNCEDLFLGRFEKGSKVPRVLYPDRCPFSDTRYFDVYGATAVASNKQAGDIFKTRTIPITIANQPGDYAQPTPAQGLPLKTRLTAWRGHMMGRELPVVQQIPDVSGRLWDISQPLLQICQQECPEAIPTFHSYIQEVAAERAQDKSTSYDADIVKVIRDLSPVGAKDWKLSTSAVVNCLNQGRQPEFYSHVGPTGKKLRGMGFMARTVNGKSVIFLNRRDFDLCLAQYGLDPAPERKQGVPGNVNTDSIVDNILNRIKAI